MTTVEAYGELLRLGNPILTTREAAARLGLSLSRTSNILRGLEEAGVVRHLRIGLWAMGAQIDPFSVAPYLTAPFPAYVSFWSALARHGMIEQIPRQIFVASPDRTRKVPTSIGTYSIHRIVPELFDGYEGSEQTGYFATPEKALFDTVYLRAPRGGRAFLPELSLPENFDKELLQTWLSRIARPRLRTLVARGLEEVLLHATEESDSAN
jgi:predicted transcriptional regulator of viral defense system